MKYFNFVDMSSDMRITKVNFDLKTILMTGVFPAGWIIEDFDALNTTAAASVTMGRVIDKIKDNMYSDMEHTLDYNAFDSISWSGVFGEEVNKVISSYVVQGLLDRGSKTLTDSIKELAGAEKDFEKFSHDMRSIGY